MKDNNKVIIFSMEVNKNSEIGTKNAIAFLCIL